MAYQVLARKYRPQSFSDVAGQDHVTRTLMNALAQGRIAHGYIFSGHRGIGKTTIARILAMALNCRTPIGEIGSDETPARLTPEPCGACYSCTEIRAGNAVDVIEIDAATNRGIDEIRELRDAARYRPARDRYKIYILDEAHQITDAAFNALLKTLEEPPDHVVFMMATTQPEDIPQTIRSRCQHFSFHAVKFDDILTQLRSIATQEQVGADDEALALLAEAGDGSMRDALSIMDQAIASAPLVHGAEGSAGRVQLDANQIRELMGSVPNTVFERLLEAISENQSGPVIDEINRLLNAGNSASQLARQFVRYLRNVLMARIAGENSELLQLSPDERTRVSRSALLFSEEDLTRFLQIMLRTFDELNYRQEPRFHLELGLLKLVHLQRLLPVEQLLSQLRSGAPPPRLGGGPLPGRTSADMATRPGTAARSQAGTLTNSQQNGASLIDPRPASAPGSSPEIPSQLPPRQIVEQLRTTGSAQLSSLPPIAPAPPTFSPFEEDSRRKGSEMSARPGTASTSMAASPAAKTASVGVLEMDEPVAVHESLSGIVPDTVAEAVLAGTPAIPPVSPVEEWSRAELQSPAEPSIAPASEESSPASSSSTPSLSAVPEISSVRSQVPSSPIAASLPAPQNGSSPELKLLAEPSDYAASMDQTASGPATSGNLDTIRERVVSALDQAGHNTAAALLQNGVWHDEGGTIRVEVAAKKTMLGLTMNAEAERISREAIRQLDSDARARTLTFVPGEATGRRPSAGAANVKPPSTGSIQAQALENPLVKQAQELFHAEIRSIVDLRNK